jgi:hypothetical protein
VVSCTILFGGLNRTSLGLQTTSRRNRLKLNLTRLNWDSARHPSEHASSSLALAALIASLEGLGSSSSILRVQMQENTENLGDSSEFLRIVPERVRVLSPARDDMTSHH